MANTTTLQVGAYNPITDTFTQVLDLNDRVTYYLHAGAGHAGGGVGLKMDQPEKVKVSAFNVRTPGEYVSRVQYKNRVIQVSIWLRATASTTALLTAVRNLLGAIERPPYVLRIQLPGGTQYSYADVVHVTHNIPTDPQVILAGAIAHVELHFECLPFLRGDRITLSNLLINPGFEAPSGPAVQVFNDNFANFNGYTVSTGGPLAQGTTGFPDAVDALNGAAGTGGTLAVARYYRLDEASGTTANDASGNAQAGTYQASPTLGAASLLTGDTDAAVTFASASSQYVNCPTTGLPTGNTNISLFCRLKFSANPAATQYLMTYGGGAGGIHNYIGLFLDSSGRLNADVGGTTVQSAALTTGAAHSALVTWDGTTLRFYVDGATVGTPQTPGNQTIPTSSLFYRLAATANTSANLFFNGTLDECLLISGCVTSTQASALHTAATTAPGTSANTMQLPSGTRLLFGSSQWGPINLWTIRWRWITSLNAVFYLHYANFTNWLGVSIIGTQMQLIHSVAGTQHVLASVSALGLVNGVWYWLQVTAYPSDTIGGSLPLVAASLFNDSGGTLGSKIQSTAGPVVAFDGVTALLGNSAIQANNAALTVGGNFAGVHTVGLFGPGGWYSSSTGTGTPYFAWEKNLSNTYGGGPVTSYGAGRIDAAPAGTLSALWLSADISNIPGTACPVAVPTDIIGVSVWVKTANLNATHGTVTATLNEYDASGAFLRQTLVGQIAGTGGITAYAQLSGAVTTGANCAYVTLALAVTDTSGTSPSAAVWFDNCQVWDQSATGAATMPYCELRFAQTPAMLIVSGLVGDVPAPCFLEAGTFLASLPANSQLLFYMGRRALVDAKCQLVAQSYKGVGSTPSAVLDATSYSGYYATSGTGQSGYANNPRPWVDEYISSLVGNYHALYRLFTSQATVANVAARIDDIVGQTALYGTFYTPFTAANTWKFADLGLFNLPPTPVVSETDLTQLFAGPYIEMTDSTGGGSEMRDNCGLLLPVDGELVIAAFNNPSNGSTLTNQWLWFYCDGTLVSGPAVGFSYAGSGLPMPAQGINVPGTLSTGYISVQNAQESYVQVDPTLDTITNQVNMGVNQFGVLLTDTSGGIYPIHCYLLYSPRYLYPR